MTGAISITFWLFPFRLGQKKSATWVPYVTHKSIRSTIFTINKTQIFQKKSVPDPWHFGTDPDPWIRTFVLRIQIQILLFSLVTSKMLKNKFFFSFVLHITTSVGTFTSVFKLKKSQNSRNQGFYWFFACWRKKIITDPDPRSQKTYPTYWSYGSGSGTLRKSLTGRQKTGGSSCWNILPLFYFGV